MGVLSFRFSHVQCTVGQCLLSFYPIPGILRGSLVLLCSAVQEESGGISLGRKTQIGCYIKCLSIFSLMVGHPQTCPLFFIHSVLFSHLQCVPLALKHIITSTTGKTKIQSCSSSFSCFKIDKYVPSLASPGALQNPQPSHHHDHVTQVTKCTVSLSHSDLLFLL